jgi:hypothetical protein
MSDNAVASGALQILAGVVFYYLIRFSLEGDREEPGISVSRRMYGLQFLLGVIMIGWGVMEFVGHDLLYSRVPYSLAGTVTWMVLLVLAVPILPWSHWFSRAVERLPEGVTLALVTFLSGVALKFASLFAVVYPDLKWQQKLVVYVLGILGCAHALSGLFSAGSRRKLLGSLPAFFFSLILVSVGVSRNDLVISAYFAAVFIPVFTGILLYASVMRPGGAVQKAFVLLLGAVVIGLPGTPVFLIFSSIGARSLDLGVSYMILFILLWFLYFSANIYIYRRVFMDTEPLAPGEASVLDRGPISFAAYGIFLIVFIVSVTQAAWRLL